MGCQCFYRIRIRDLMISNDNEKKNRPRDRWSIIGYLRKHATAIVSGERELLFNRSRGRDRTFHNITTMSLPLAFRMSSDLTNSARSRYSTPST